MVAGVKGYRTCGFGFLQCRWFYGFLGCVVGFLEHVGRGLTHRWLCAGLFLPYMFWGTMREPKGELKWC